MLKRLAFGLAIGVLVGCGASSVTGPDADHAALTADREERAGGYDEDGIMRPPPDDPFDRRPGPNH